MPMKTEIASLLIVTKLQQFDYPGASAIALLMLVSSFLLLFLVNFGQWWSTRAQRREL
jgi:sulfate transport system permease protein